MPIPGSETYRSSEPPETTKDTTISDDAVAPEVVEGPDWPKEAPVLISLEPESLAVPGPDSEVVITGTGFTQESIIVWNHGDELTEFVNETELKTLVKPSTVEAPLPFTLPVQVRNGNQTSEPLEFTFVAEEPVAREEEEEDSHHGQTRRHRKQN
jgi:hypothetical protein